MAVAVNDPAHSITIGHRMMLSRSARSTNPTDVAVVYTIHRSVRCAGRISLPSGRVMRRWNIKAGVSVSASRSPASASSRPASPRSLVVSKLQDSTPIATAAANACTIDAVGQCCRSVMTMPATAHTIAKHDSTTRAVVAALPATTGATMSGDCGRPGDPQTDVRGDGSTLAGLDVEGANRECEPFVHEMRSVAGGLTAVVDRRGRPSSEPVAGQHLPRAGRGSRAGSSGLPSAAG